MTTKQHTRSYREDITGRALQFLRAVGTSDEIRGLLATAGYAVEDQLEGWNLICSITGFPSDTAVKKEGNPVAEAISAIEEWSEGALRRGRNALERLHEEEAAAIFGGLEPSKGMECAVATKLILDRMDALEAKKGSKETFETLTKRGVTKAERKRVRALVDLAHSTPKVQMAVAADTREEELKKLRAWLADWSDTARTVIQRRDYLIRLGVARRKTGTTPVPPAVVVNPAAPALPAMGQTEFAHAAE